MKLYTLLFGRTKKKKKPIMIDSHEKCDRYMKARSNVSGFHEIVEAPEGSKTWRQRTATIGGNTCQSHKSNGYISKNGFNPHT